LDNIGGELNYVLNSPGKNFFSAVEMSRQAPFVDAATSIDPVNRSNTFISYYSYGSVIALALDLELRQKFKNITLDDYMRAMWQMYGKPEKPYTLTDLQNTLATITKDAFFAENFFQRHVYGQTPADYTQLLSAAGLLLRKSHAGRASLGLTPISFPEGKATIAAYPYIGSPLYQAGLDRQDSIVSLAGKSLNSKTDLDAILAAHQPGESLPIEYIQRGEIKKASITLTEDPSLEVVPAEKTGIKLSKAQKAFRNQWFGSRQL
jgi:predicted metalloprotease with PDZ domain